MKKKAAVILPALLALMLVFSMVLVSCGGKGSSQQAAAKKEKVYRWVLQADVPSLNAQFEVDSNVHDIYQLASAGLYIGVPTSDGKLATIPNLADGEPQKMDADGYVWRINIRKEAKWNNGDPINADTFIYSYRMLLDPLLVNRMANFLYDLFIKIENAREYYIQAQPGNPKVAWEDVGIKKVGDYTIELKLLQKSNVEYVKRHFVDRSTFPVYEPYYERGMNAERTSTTWGSTLDNFMGCGPYFYQTWNVGSEHIWVKNYDHWMKDVFKMDRIELRIVSDRNARVQMFQNGELETLILDNVTLETFKDDPRVLKFTGLSPYHIDINSVNTNQPILANPDFRKALYYVIDRKTVADFLGVALPAGYYVNHQAAGYDGMAYRDTPEAKAIEPANYGYDPVLAKQYFDKALSDMRLSKVNIELLYSEDGADYRAMAEFFEQDWPRVFGADKFTLTLKMVPDAMAWSLNKWKDVPNGFELGFNDWGSSLSRVFPYAAFQYFHSGYNSRPNSYVTPAFDAAFQACDSEEARSNPRLLVQRTVELEKQYLADVINVPIFHQYVQVINSEKVILPSTNYIPGCAFSDKFGALVGGDMIVD